MKNYHLIICILLLFNLAACSMQAVPEPTATAVPPTPTPIPWPTPDHSITAVSKREATDTKE